MIISSLSPLSYEAQLSDGSRSAFVAHEHPGLEHIAMSLPWPPMEKLRTHLQQRLSTQLMTRGESHITVVTPPEFKALSPWLGIAELNAIAVQGHIQQGQVEVVCVGKGEVTLNGETAATYYVVVRAPHLRQIREAIEKKLRTLGAGSEVFSASHYFPHITIGFTHRDLFDSDGVIKDEKSCVIPLQIAP